MLSVAQMKHIEPNLGRLSEAEIEAIRDQLYGFGELAFASWLSHLKGGFQNPVGVMAEQLDRGKIKVWKS